MPERRPVSAGPVLPRQAVSSGLAVLAGALWITLPLAAAPAQGPPATAPDAEARLALYRKAQEFPDLVRGGTVEPHWLPDGTGFWYEVDGGGGEGAENVIYRVDPATGAKERLGAPPDEEPGPEPRVIRPSLFPGFPPVREVPSPDGRWFLTERDSDLWLRAADPGDGQDVKQGEDGLRRLTDDGTADFHWKVVQDELWMRALWSPDGGRVLAIKEDRRGVDREPVVHWLERTPTVEWVPLPKSGRPLARTELWVIEVATGDRVRIALGEEDVYQAPVGWLPARPGTPDAEAAPSEIFLLTAERDFGAVRLLAADPATGAVRTVIEERSPTFVKNLSIAPGWEEIATLLPAGVPAGEAAARIVWQSERDGWDHLYLYDLEGKLLRRLTAPESPERPWPVLRVVAVDEAPGWVYFTAHAEPGRPYDTHLYRVGLDGGGVSRLTEAPGEHDVQLSPSRQVFLDTHSTLDRPPRTELRRADGGLIAVLEEADVSALGPLGFRPPKPFVVKAADGVTDLHGVLYLPWWLDPETAPDGALPIVEDLYAGPFRVHHQRRFVTGSAWRGTYPQALAQLGFAVVSLDGRGTPERGKAFQDHIWRRFGQVEIPDHAAALRNLAAGRPYLDLDRVGAFGGSWGAYMTVRALLTAPDLYKAGVAANGVYDFVDHGATGLEGYLGLPEDNPEGYAAGSSLTLVDRLEGQLLLMHGTADVNATFSATMKLVDALARAGKPYNLIVLPDQSHHYEGYALEYRKEAIRRHFQEHLQPE